MDGSVVVVVKFELVTTITAKVGAKVECIVMPYCCFVAHCMFSHVVRT